MDAFYKPQDFEFAAYLRGRAVTSPHSRGHTGFQSLEIL